MKEAMMVTTLSNRLPRQYAIATPSSTPSVKLISSAVPTLNSVQGRKRRICEMTVVPGDVIDSPRSPCSRLSMYEPYCCTSGAPGSK
ncbi:MAG: hypothetical protein U0703_06295 [Anaerolineae bacterium]